MPSFPLLVLFYERTYLCRKPDVIFVHVVNLLNDILFDFINVHINMYHPFPWSLLFLLYIVTASDCRSHRDM